MRRKQLTLTYAANISSNKGNFNYSEVFSKRYKVIYDQNKNIVPPLYERVNILSAELNIHFPSILPIQYSNPPPWTILPPNINTHLKLYHKADSHPSAILQAFRQMCTTYINYQFIYTDASKDECGVGSAVVCPGKILQYNLPEICSNFTGELYSILEALKHVNETQNQKYVICTDSLSSIQSIQQLYSRNPLVQAVKLEISRLSTTHNTVIIAYVPSHIGIQGNEAADQSAREAIYSANSQNINICTHFDLKNHVKDVISSVKEKEWKESNSKLRKINSSTHHSLPLPTSRRNQVVISRLRIGHTRYTHEHLFNRQEAPFCDICQTQITVDHIITGCQKYIRQREKHAIPATLKEAIGSNLQCVEKTIHINLLNKMQLKLYFACLQLL